MNRLALILLWLLCLMAAVIGLAWMAIAIIPGSRRALVIAKGFDRLAAAFSRGDDSEYISSTCWRYRGEQPYRSLRVLIDAAFVLMGQTNHCQQSYKHERDRAQARAAITIEPGG